MISRARRRFLPATVLLLLAPLPCQTEDGLCGDVQEGKGRLFSLSVDRKLDQRTGDWIRTFSAQNADSDSSVDDIQLDVSHSNVKCHGRNMVRMKVMVRELKSISNGLGNNSLVFHERHGENVLLTEGGRGAQKINLDDQYNAVLFTHRPLRNDEIFEIRLEKKIKKTNNALGIGVVNFSPDDVEILPQMHVRNETWIMKHNSIYQSNKNINANYGKSLDAMEVNDRVGVMRRSDGELHFYINGDDQGVAAVVPEGVYGVLELWRDAVKARILY